VDKYDLLYNETNCLFLVSVDSLFHFEKISYNEIALNAQTKAQLSSRINLYRNYKYIFSRTLCAWSIYVRSEIQCQEMLWEFCAAFIHIFLYDENRKTIIYFIEYK